MWHQKSMQKLVLLMLIICRYLDSIVPNEHLRWFFYCQQDYLFCPQCFSGCINNDNVVVGFIDNCCSSFLDEIELTTTIDSTINSIFGSRNLQFGVWERWQQQLPSDHQPHLDPIKIPIVLKHLSNDDKLDRTKGALCDWLRHNQTEIDVDSLADCISLWQQFAVYSDSALSLETGLRRVYEMNQWADGIKQCPTVATDNFIKTFDQFESRSLFWIQLLINPELVFLKAVRKAAANGQGQVNRFVPSLYRWCGFVVIEQYAGISLYSFYEHSFGDRIFLAQQILQAAMAFSHGINGLRFYLTDATPDNIVVDADSLQLTFVDLDNLIVADSLAYSHQNSAAVEDKPATWHRIHRHEKIKCNGCFAYVPAELCAHHLSDINLFTVCQMFAEDLYGDKSKGLLHSIPDPQSAALSQLLTECVQCEHYESCENRFDVANQLLIEFARISTVENVEE